MKKNFQREIKSPFSYRFDISGEGIYALTFKALCKPGWRNRWWLKLKGFLIQLKAGPRIFKEFFYELKEPPFVHKNVDGKPLTVLNRATYALYRYTPHLAGADLFYRVYAQFFGKSDLGGKI